MNQDILKGRWNQIKGEVQKQWGKLTDNDLDRIEGEATRLQGIVQEKYGHSKEDIKTQLSDLLRKFQEEDTIEEV